MKTITAEQMRILDAMTIQAGIPASELMEKAGRGVADEIAAFAVHLPSVHVRRFVFLAGKGNNGGDVYVAARYLREAVAVPILIYSIVPLNRLRGETALNASRLPHGVNVMEVEQLTDGHFECGDIIIDGLLGTGVSGELKPPYPQWIEAVNRSGMPVVALDLPSGLDGDTGAVTNAAIQADLTVTIALPKHGLYQGRGLELCGRLRCVNIGIPHSFIETVDSDVSLSFATDIAPRLGRIACDCHKNSRGRVTVFGGSAAYPGAPVLTSKMAMRTGAGYVRMVLPESAGHSGCWPDSLVVNRLPDTDGGFGVNSVEPALELLSGADAIILGPGMGNGRDTVSFVSALWDQQLPMVIDADGLNILASAPELYRGNEEHVLTPHPGEMKRLLTGYGLERLLDSDRISQARGVAEKTGSTIVLKGHRTLIASPGGRITVNGSGTAGLAKAGSGDCLSGMIGTFLAQGMSPFESAETAVFIHGYAAELSPWGIRGMTADDLPQLVIAAMRELSPFA